MYPRGGIVSAVALLAALAPGPATGQTLATGTPPEPAALAFASPAGTYAIGDEILVSATFDRPVTASAGVSIEIEIGGTPRRAAYRSGGGTAALVFAYAVVEGDRDGDGIAIGAGRLTASPGGIPGPGGAAASLSHAAVPADATRTVDGVRPTALYASVDRGMLAVTWDEALTVADGPGDPGGFALYVGGAPASIGAVGVSERQVLLALDRAVADGDWVTLSYTPPETRPIRDLAGNAAAGFSLTVTAGERGICRRGPAVRSREFALLHAAGPHAGNAPKPASWADA